MILELKLSKDTYANLLCSVIESGRTYGCGYWAVADRSLSKKPAVASEREITECGLGPTMVWYAHWPLLGGNLVFIDEDANTWYVLDMEAMERGALMMAQKYPHKFASVVMDEIDGPLGDLFLQCCFFGEEKYA